MSSSVLALDLGDRTGFAYTDSALGRVVAGARDLKLRKKTDGHGEDEHAGSRWARAREQFRLLLAGRDLVAWERVVAHTAPWASSTLYGLETVLVELAWALKVETLTVMPSTLKKFATGNGRAKKDEMRRMALERWPILGAGGVTHDEIDARWVLEWALSGGVKA